MQQAASRSDPRRQESRNRCGAPATPKITLIDMNGDGRKEAFFVDAGGCYKPDGRWYAVTTKGADGNWRGILSGVGSVPGDRQHGQWLVRAQHDGRGEDADRDL